MEEAYERRHDVDQVKLRESVAAYEVGNVAEKHMRPTIDSLLEHFAARKPVAA